MPGWRQRRCIGGIITTTTGGIAGTIVITTIIVIGIAGKRDRLAQISRRPAPWRACFDLKDCLESGEIAQRYRWSSESSRGAIMKSAIGAAFVVVALAVAGPTAISPVAAASPTKAQRALTSEFIDFSAPRQVRRSYRHPSYHRPYYYYDRPVYYRPYPYSTPAPFIFGIGFDPPWW